MGIFFNDPIKPRVTKEELQLIKGKLRYTYNFTEREVKQIEEIFRGDMDETRYKDKGIDTEELVKGIQWMRKNPNTHHISPKKIDILEVEMMKRITSTYTGNSIL